MGYAVVEPGVNSGLNLINYTQECVKTSKIRVLEQRNRILRACSKGN